MTKKRRYVEVSWEHPTDGTRFRAVIVDAGSPDDAFAHAVADTQRAHPEATTVKQFMQRVVSAKADGRIQEQMVAGTWTGRAPGARSAGASPRPTRNKVA